MKKRWRMVGLMLAATLLLAVPVSHLLRAAPPAGSKKLICHLDENGSGRVLEISVNAIPHHCRRHPGDYTTPPTGTTLVKGAACAPVANAVCR